MRDAEKEKQVSMASMALRGTLDAAALIRAGAMHRRMAWTGLEGARKYVEAVAAGDVASEAEIERRMQACRACTAPTPLPANPRVTLGYCGPAFTDLTHEGIAIEERSCGCLIMGKVMVESEKCPRGKWEAVTE